jgi:hypothetical protein
MNDAHNSLYSTEYVDLADKGSWTIHPEAFLTLLDFYQASLSEEDEKWYLPAPVNWDVK